MRVRSRHRMEDVGDRYAVFTSASGDARTKSRSSGRFAAIRMTVREIVILMRALPLVMLMRAQRAEDLLCRRIRNRPLYWPHTRLLQKRRRRMVAHSKARRPHPDRAVGVDLDVI